jgi:hypothetical protein
MAKAWWLWAVLLWGCSDPDPPAEDTHAAASLSFTLSEPDGERTCFGAATAPYLVGSEDAPVTAETSCEIHETDQESWISGQLAGPGGAAGHVVFSISSENGIEVTLVSEVTGTLTDAPSGPGCGLFTATLGAYASADFDCSLLVDQNDATSGCAVTGTVNFENCDER